MGKCNVFEHIHSLQLVREKEKEKRDREEFAIFFSFSIDTTCDTDLAFYMHHTNSLTTTLLTRRVN